MSFHHHSRRRSPLLLLQLIPTPQRLHQTKNQNRDHHISSDPDPGGEEAAAVLIDAEEDEAADADPHHARAHPGQERRGALLGTNAREGVGDARVGPAVRVLCMYVCMCFAVKREAKRVGVCDENE